MKCDHDLVHYVYTSLSPKHNIIRLSQSSKFMFSRVVLLLLLLLCACAVDKTFAVPRGQEDGSSKASATEGVCHALPRAAGRAQQPRAALLQRVAEIVRRASPSVWEGGVEASGRPCTVPEG